MGQAHQGVVDETSREWMTFTMCKSATHPKLEPSDPRFLATEIRQKQHSDLVQDLHHMLNFFEPNHLHWLCCNGCAHQEMPKYDDDFQLYTCFNGLSCERTRLGQHPLLTRRSRLDHDWFASSVEFLARWPGESCTYQISQNLKDAN